MHLTVKERKSAFTMTERWTSIYRTIGSGRRERWSAINRGKIMLGSGRRERRAGKATVMITSAAALFKV